MAQFSGLSNQVGGGDVIDWKLGEQGVGAEPDGAFSS